jgi:uncharacterized membrane protein
MAELTRQQAQARADQVRVFQRELEPVRLEGVRVLDEAQQAALRTHHARLLAELGAGFDIDRDLRSKDLSLGMRIASFLGALAIAASVVYLFAQFWGRFDTPAQAAIVIAASLGSFLAAMWLHRRDASGYFTKLAALVAFACLVLDTVLLGSIFNITPTDRALLAWAAFALLLAYSCDLRLLLVAGILCIIAYTSARMGTWSGMYWLSFGERPENFLPVAVAIFALPQLVDHRRFDGFAATWRILGLLCFLLPVLLLSNWGDSSYLRLEADTIEGGYQVLGFAASAGAIWLGIRRRWTHVTNTGVVFFVIFLYTKFFDWWWESMPKYLFFLVLGLVAILLLSVLRRVRALVVAQEAAA